MSSPHHPDRSPGRQLLSQAYRLLFRLARRVIKPLIPSALYRSPAIARILARLPSPPGRVARGPVSPATDGQLDYARKIENEIATFKDIEHVHDLPAIAMRWGHVVLRPMFQEYGIDNADQLFAKGLAQAARDCGDTNPRYVSIGSGNCDTEIRVALMLRETIGPNFVIECLELNPHMLERGRAQATQEGVEANLAFIRADFNAWKATTSYTGAMANQSLHHVVNLEGLFDEIQRSLKPEGAFVISDMIGRNGHMRWPEALEAMAPFWKEMPESFRYNHQLRRYEDPYQNWDCSQDGFEGIRAQDILPLLLDRFHFSFFLGYGNVLDIFIDRGFGHHFDPDREWDWDFISRIHAVDEAGFQDGSLTPTHIAAVMHKTAGRPLVSPRGLDPAACVRDPAQPGARGRKSPASRTKAPVTITP